ncbi:unnamed protein product, partial [Hapterophycus canaliculatus]
PLCTSNFRALYLPPSTPETGQIRVELSAPHGKLTLSTVAGLTFESGSGHGDDFIVFTGHPGNANRALRGAVYRGDPHWN